jgi:L-amino acid N-acyltransferase YncA
MKIRRAEVKDAGGIAKVHVDSWRTTYKGIVPDQYLNGLSYKQREENWRSHLGSSEVFVAETDEGEIVGFSSGGKERSGNYPGYDGEVYAIYILKEYQNKGLGKKLTHPLVEGFRKQGIHSMLVLVLEENPSRHFYEALGAKWMDSMDVEIGGIPLRERVYGWTEFSAFPD